MTRFGRPENRRVTYAPLSLARQCHGARNLLENSNRSHALSNRSGVGEAAQTWKLQSAWPRPGLEMRRKPRFVGVFRARQTPDDPLTAATRPILVACKGID